MRLGNAHFDLICVSFKYIIRMAILAQGKLIFLQKVQNEKKKRRKQEFRVTLNNLQQEQQ